VVSDKQLQYRCYGYREELQEIVRQYNETGHVANTRAFNRLGQEVTG